jgi:hypothetical protein
VAVPYARNMHQTATYWAPGGNDGFGGQTFAAPVALACRWQDVAEMFRDPQGREVVSEAIVYTAERVAVGGYLFLGSSGEPSPPALGAKEVRQLDVSPNLRNTEELHKAYL